MAWHGYRSNKKLVHVCIILFYILVTLQCVYVALLSGNIRYVKNALKTHNNTKEKTKENGFIY